MTSSRRAEIHLSLGRFGHHDHGCSSPSITSAWPAAIWTKRPKPTHCWAIRPKVMISVDERQGIRGRFIVGPGPRLELLVALPGSTVLEPWLRKGVKYYHEAFFVPDLGRGIDELCANGGKVVVEPVPAVAFDNREIAFVMLPNVTLVELVQAPSL